MTEEQERLNAIKALLEPDAFEHIGLNLVPANDRQPWLGSHYQSHVSALLSATELIRERAEDAERELEEERQYLAALNVQTIDKAGSRIPVATAIKHIIEVFAELARLQAKEAAVEDERRDVVARLRAVTGGDECGCDSCTMDRYGSAIDDIESGAHVPKEEPAT